MNKTKVIILLLFLFISLVFALEWRLAIEVVDKAYKIVGLKTPTYILTIIEKESGLGKNLGSNLGSKENNLNRCAGMCYWTKEKNKIDGKKLVYCFDKEKQVFTIDARGEWCHQQYSALEKITSNLGLDINKIPFSPNFGIGYTQFQPTTWLQYRELQNRNPWNLYDSLYAAALKLKYDGINENEIKAIEKYDPNPIYFLDYQSKRQEWDQILDDTIFVYDCSSNDFSCALSIIKTNYPECTENDWPIKKKKECIKTKVAFQKEQKLAQKQREAALLALEIKILETKESTPTYIEKKFSLLSNLFDVFRKEKSKQEFFQNIQYISQPYSLNVPINQEVNKNEQKEEKITYKEEKKEIVIERKNENLTKDLAQLEKNKVQEIKITQNKTQNTETTITPVTTTLTATTSTLREQIIPKETSRPIVYIGGGTPSPITSQTPKDPCDDYKNKNYPKIIISEIQFENEDNKDEFIELYLPAGKAGNPSNEEIDLACWKLEKYASKQTPTSTPTLTTLIPPSKFKGKIKPNSYFLITSSSTKEKYQGDLSYAESYSISKNNVIILRKPNGEISDLVGYGDNIEKIYQYENSPFIAQSFENKSIQRKNFQDNDNNLKDFWLRQPTPKNSNFTELPREDFIDLTEIEIKYFQVISTSTEDSYFLNISFIEPTATITTSTNYSYDLLISTSTDFSTFKLEDFGINSTLSQPKFDDSATTLSFEINKCPTTSTLYYFALFIKDNLDEENKTNFAIASTTLPEDLCNQEEPILTQNLSTITTTSTGKILFSEIYIKEGTSTDEFIELYNPNEFAIDLTGWEIRRINKNGNTDEIKDVIGLKGIIHSFSYFLLINSNTSSEIIINPDLLYKKSFNLAKDNALILIDKEGNVVDQICWGEPKDFQNCAPNPSQELLSFQRKKTATSTSETIINQDVGNAYSTNNPSNDFVYAPINPENSLITKPTIKEIQDFKITNIGKIYQFSWLSPAYYDENLNYELLFSTSSEFQIINLIPFKILENQSLDLNFCNLDIPSETDLYFRLNLLKNDQILETLSTSTKIIDCNDFSNNFGKIIEKTDHRYHNNMFYVIERKTW